jgi:hypothetical protein
MTRFAVLTLACLLAAGAAHAQRVSDVKGTTLMRACTGPSPTACNAYVDGFGDAISASGSPLACIPIHATGTELRDVLVAYLKSHPQDQHMEAAAIAKQAFSKAYPCNK